MEQNPYAKFLSGCDPLDVIASTAGHLKHLAARMPEEQRALRQPAGKWTAREIIAHLADCELVFSFRLRQTLADDHPTVQPFDQDRWAARYANRDLDTSLALFDSARRSNLQLIESTAPEDRRRLVTHPERGTMTFWTLVETMAGHDVNHLLQLERLATAP
ncbi:MAG TPA: DinB family protein [Acidobacteriaceae bacterium]|nr:DinB family protein [Acidobacteriaceae bacterium]